MNIVNELVKIPYKMVFEDVACVEEKGIILNSMQVYRVIGNSINEEIGFHTRNIDGKFYIYPDAYSEAYLLSAERIVEVSKLIVKSDDYLRKHIGYNGDCTFLLVNEE